MKHELKRIAATLNQLQAQSQPAAASLSLNAGSAASVGSEPVGSKSVGSEPVGSPPTDSLLLPTVPPAPPTPRPTASTTAVSPVSFEVQPRSLPTGPANEIARSLDQPDALAEVGNNLALPLVPSTAFTTHHHIANPQLALNLLKELQGMVQGWQDRLQQVMQQIQALYDEGPIVDGWLESYTQEDPTLSSLRHADVNCLLDYVERHWTAIQDPTDAAEPVPLEVAAGYRLCGLNQDGQLWFRHCPAEQVPLVSLAIARYQRLRQLLSQKQDLETRLGQLAETLIEGHRQGQASELR